MIEVDGETYYNAKEAANFLGITRFMFYYNVKGNIPSHKFRARRRRLYRRSDLQPFKVVESLAS